MNTTAGATTTAIGTTAAPVAPPTLIVRVTVSMDSCRTVNAIISNATAYKNASIYAMASQHPLFTVDRIEVDLTRLNCDRRLLEEGWKRFQRTNIPGVLSAFNITTPPGTTAVEFGDSLNASGFQNSLMMALAENSINVNVTEVYALTVVVNRPAGRSGGTRSESSDGLSVGAIVGIAIGCVVVLLCCIATVVLYKTRALPSQKTTTGTTIGKPSEQNEREQMAEQRANLSTS